MGMYEMKGYSDLAQMVGLGREHGQDGFVAFDLKSLLPALDQAGKSLTPGKALLPHRAPEVRFILQDTGVRSAQGYPIYENGKEVSFEAVVMLKGKLREGISRVAGDIILEKISGETVSTVESLDLDRAAIRKLNVTPPASGRYRLALAGKMTLSTGENRPFIVRGFPFEVGTVAGTGAGTDNKRPAW